MHRYRGQKALYEAMKRSQERMRQRQQLEPLHQTTVQESPPAPKVHDIQTAPKKETADPRDKRARWHRPRAVQLNAGRVEFALPLPVIFMVVMAVFLVILGFFRYGQYLGWSEAKAELALQGAEPERLEGNAESSAAPLDPDESGSQLSNPPITAVPLGEGGNPRSGNAIVILEYKDRTQLGPVQQHYLQAGVATEIRPTRNGRYILVTEKRFTENPTQAGTEADRYRKRIIDIGVRYDAPKGYLSFAPESFQGAYGIKLED